MQKATQTLSICSWKKSTHPTYIYIYIYRPKRDTEFIPYAPTIGLPSAYHDAEISICGTYGLTHSHHITPSPPHNLHFQEQPRLDIPPKEL